MKNLLTLFILINSFAMAQDYRFGKVSKDELEKTKSTIESSAAAEILYSSGKAVADWNSVSGELEMTKSVFYRIKVYDKDKTSDNILKHEVKLYRSNSDVEKISGLKVVTYNLDGGKINETKIDRKDIFSDKSSKYHHLEIFTFPNVKNGSVIEFTYDVTSPFYSATDEWFFQESIPVVKSDYVFESHEFLKYQPFTKGQFTPTNTKTDSKNKSISMSVMTRASGGSNFDRGSSTINEYKYKTESKSYSYANLPSFDREAYVLNRRNLLSSIRYELSAYIPTGRTPEFFNSTWDKIGKNLMDSDNFGSQLKGNGFLDNTVNELIAGKNSTEEKLVAIFNFVQSNCNWNNVYGITTENGIRKTFNDKVGNVSDINLMLTSMLRKAGLNANPVVLSSVSNGILDLTYPSRTKLNYVISYVEDGQNIYLMDATSKLSNINLLPTRVLNYRGIMIADNETKEIPLQNTIMSEKKLTVDAILSANGEITGRFTNTSDKYFYISDASYYAEDPKEFEKYYTEDYKLDYDNFRVQDNNAGMIRHTFDFENITTDVISNKIMFNPFLFLVENDSNLYYETRNYPLEFGAPYTVTKTIKIKIPEGYKVESLPTKNNFAVDQNVAVFGYAVEERDGYIIAQSQEVIPYSVLPQQFYKPFKEYKNKLIQTNQQQVVLAKQ